MKSIHILNEYNEFDFNHNKSNNRVKFNMFLRV